MTSTQPPAAQPLTTPRRIRASFTQACQAGVGYLKCLLDVLAGRINTFF